MLSNCIVRFISTNNILWQSPNKSLLAKLRKKTGYTFANCKKALELHENNLEKAEQWLKEQAQQLGWSKAQKLQGRSTSQGLIAAIVDKNHGSLIEINCETDFVARNKQFHELAGIVASAVLKHTTSVASDGLYNKAILDADALKALQALDGKPLADHCALTIGTLGENIGVRRALCMNVPSDVLLTGYTHPAPAEAGPITYGKYGALLAYRTEEAQEDIGKQLCQHIIGMNPTKIGDPEVDQPQKNADDETALIHQEFLLDPSMTVQQLLAETKTQILDFARFEMGEVVEGQQSLDAVETGGSTSREIIIENRSPKLGQKASRWKNHKTEQRIYKRKAASKKHTRIYAARQPIERIELPLQTMYSDDEEGERGRAGAHVR